jgi:hypothetical protein
VREVPENAPLRKRTADDVYEETLQSDDPEADDEQ